MVIGIDLRPLQMHHRFRGIGMHMLHFLEELPAQLKRGEQIVFFCYEGMDDPIGLLNLPKKFKYTVTALPQTYASNRPVPFFIKESLQNYRRVTRPLASEKIQPVDVYLMFDFMHGIPRAEDTRLVTVAYDLIPFIFPEEYFPNFFVALKKQGFNEAVRDFIVKRLYKWAAEQTVKRSSYLLSISDSTRDQFEKVVPGSSKKTHTVYLGRPERISTRGRKLAKAFPKVTSEYLLYVGGGDPRRKIEDLVEAFDRLKSSQPDLLLVLAGRDFTSIDTIPTKSIANTIKRSKYQRDIILLGFVSDEERTLLYREAVCFVYPTLSEGFGLPILEAMQEECPVITYDYEYSSIKEVAADAALVLPANEGSGGIYSAVNRLLDSPELVRDLKKRGLLNVSRFTWERNASETLYYIRKAFKG